MRGIDLSSAVGKRAGALLVLVGAFGVSGCDPTAEYRKPELTVCQRFLRSRMRVPTSFHRTWYNVSDLPVTRDVLAQATGNPAQAKTAPNPVIRRVVVQYMGNDGFGADVAGFGTCLFPMLNGAHGPYAIDIDSAVDKAVIDNEQRTLALSTGQTGVVAADCCTVPGFDVKSLDGIAPRRRNAVVAIGRKL
jgi:hypothetical protein